MIPLIVKQKGDTIISLPYIDEADKHYFLLKITCIISHRLSALTVFRIFPH